jgi:hypothetical protein
VKKKESGWREKKKMVGDKKKKKVCVTVKNVKEKRVKSEREE